MAYEYSQINRIKTPHNYMYTKYEGRLFLDDYFNFRNQCVNTLVERYSEYIDFYQNKNNAFSREQVVSAFSIVVLMSTYVKDDFLAEVKKSLEFILKQDKSIDLREIYSLSDKEWLQKSRKRFSELKNKDLIITTETLNNTIYLTSYGTGKDLEDIYSLLSLFTKKYEIFKRVFSQYDSSMKKVGSDYEDVSVYILLSLNLGLFQKKTDNLKFLNASLKLNDLICSIIDDVKGIVDILSAYVSLKLEVGLVQQLMRKKDVL